ncbi:TIGR04282 family arsenosugar biosynthesis glycosyltransferase [Desulforhabdus amnigena]|uniref:DUF2064 domain-containing protein n=1 Tax=Desulforhabdus amnigena TaxID=40218 RepID=A0A9W6D126_9BACT|nr:DUF2064 domain-containing protein [Desulforhabdus amnigena]NLJ27686.1 DUF2064 domain-containing protein [Deltaproteobacteria bacterium]GLI33024.1 hypothetical protein DAMNIGENAA_04570 [Desulforhabdus amnigena]
MKAKKHALVLFTKYPEPGLTKTRLMEENGGNLTPAEAAALYKAMVLDTASVALHILSNGLYQDRPGDDFRFCISSPAEQLPKVQEMFRAEFPFDMIEYVEDKGRNFDEHFDSCYRQLFDRGYHTVVCIGGDLPGITPNLVCRAFQSLFRLGDSSGRGAMVLAPCQAGGVSLVGITRETPITFGGVFYNTRGVTALDALIDLASQKDIPVALFEALFDVDYGEDLGHMISVINAMSYASRFDEGFLVPRRTLDFISSTGLAAISQPNESRDPRETIDG